MGGGMRQAGYLAAAGIYALEHHVERLAEDHEHARILEQALNQVHWVRSIRPVQSNILLFDVADHLQASEVLHVLRAQGIHASGFGPKTIRFVTHLDVSRDMIHQAVNAIHQADLPKA